MTIDELKAELADPKYSGLKPADILVALKAEDIPVPDVPVIVDPGPPMTSRLKELGWPADLSVDDITTALALKDGGAVVVAATADAEVAQ